MRKYNVTFNPTTILKKPKTKREYGKLHDSVIITTGLTIPEIATYTSKPYSYTFAPATFSGTPKNDNWVSQSVFMLDFDGGVSPDEIICVFGKFGIKPNIYYETLSSTSENIRFRIILVVDTEIKNEELAAAIRKGLVDVFPKADKKCKDASRIFLGGQKSYIISAEPIPVEKLVEFICINEVSKDNQKTRKIEEKTLLLYNNIGITEINQNTCTSLVDPANQSYLERIRNNEFDFEECRKRVKILDDFLNGVWLDHPKLFALATNMYWVRGGLKLMKDTMVKYNNLGMTRYDENNFAALVYIRKCGYYKPQWLQSFSDYTEDAKYSNIIAAVKNIRGMIDVLEPINRVSLQEGETHLTETIDLVLDKKDNSINILVLSTGIGKTREICRIPNVTICSPTHLQIDEKLERMSVDYVTTPNLPDFDDAHISQKIRSLQKSGVYDEAVKLIKNIAYHSTKYNSNDRAKAQQYLTALTIAKESSITVLTTHERGLLTDFKHQTLLFDEDPIQSLIDNKTLLISDLISLECYTNGKQELGLLIDHLRKAEPGVFYDNNIPEIDIEYLQFLVSGIQTESNVLSIFKSNFFVKDLKNHNLIHYTTVRELPDDKKVVILSATAQVDMYRKLYGDRVHVYELDLVEHMGEVVQDCSRSYSRSSLKNTDIKNIKEKIGNDPVITFMSFSDELNNEDLSIYFGNCSGSDKLKGRNINILGTPHQNPLVYLSYAKALKFDVDSMDQNMCEQQVEWKGIRFPFMTYKNEQLRRIQLSLIESELVQSVGRARPIRTEAKVMVYSNFPLRITDRFVENKLHQTE